MMSEKQDSSKLLKSKVRRPRASLCEAVNVVDDEEATCRRTRHSVAVDGSDTKPRRAGTVAR